MKKPKSIFFIIYLLFHVLLLVVSIYVNYRSEDFEFLLYLRGKMALMVYISVIGLVLYFINLVVVGMEERSSKKDKEALQQEINSLKAKMFDLQDASSSSQQSAKPEKGGEVEEDTDEGEN